MSHFITHWIEKITPKSLQRKSERISWLDIPIHEKWCTFSNSIQIEEELHFVIEFNVFLIYTKKKLYDKNT